MDNNTYPNKGKELFLSITEVVIDVPLLGKADFSNFVVCGSHYQIYYFIFSFSYRLVGQEKVNVPEITDQDF